MIRKHDITMEYELNGERVSMHVDKNTFINEIKLGDKSILWKYDTEGNICDITTFPDFNITYDKKWIRENIRYIKREGKYIGYKICFNFKNIRYVVTLDPNDKIIKIIYEQNGKLKECNFCSLNISTTDRSILMLVLSLIDKELENQYNKNLNKHMQQIFDIKGDNNMTKNNNKKFKNEDTSKKKSIEGKLSSDNLTQYKNEIINEFNKYNSSVLKPCDIKNDFIFTNKPDYSDNVIPQIPYNKSLLDKSINEFMDLDKIRENPFEKVLYSENKIDDKKEHAINKDKKVMFNDTLILTKKAKLIESLELNNHLCKDEILSIIKNIDNKLYNKYNKNFVVEMVDPKTYIQRLIFNNNVDIYPLLNISDMKLVKYLEENNTLQGNPDFNINKKSSILIDNKSSEIITISIYIPTECPYESILDKKNISKLKEYGLI